MMPLSPDDDVDKASYRRKNNLPTSDILSGIVIITEYPLSNVFSNCRPEGDCILYLDGASKREANS